jgi:N-acetylmuramoyl-L-alanine amidase
MFSPGAFRGLKVFILKRPTRLVLDVYMKDAQRREPYDRPKKRETAKGLNRIETLVIDPGHGGFETGIVKEREKEKNTVLDIAKKLQALVNTGSSKGDLTRGSDHYMAMSERIKFTNSKATNVFLSIHVGHHSGIVIYTPVITDHVSGIVKPYLYNRGQADYAKDTATLLRAVNEALISHFGDDTVSIRPIPYSMLSRIEAAALMIEFPSFEDAYYIEEFNSEIAQALYKGLYIYEEIKEK